MTDPLAFCPGCGCNLAAEQPVELGRLRVDPRGDVCWNGLAVPFTSAEHILFGTLAQAKGRIVGHDVLNERIGYEGDHGVVAVFLFKIRRKLRAVGAPADLVTNVRGRGHRINLEAVICQ